MKYVKRGLIVALMVVGLVLSIGSEGAFQSKGLQFGSAGKSVQLAYVNWDTEIASTNVIAKVLEDEGYSVEMVPLDNAVMWQSIAQGESDAMVAAWLPVTHEAQLAEYGDQMEDLGPNLEGAKTGLVVPDYMDVDSITDLTDQAGQQLTGIEPGAGIMNSSETAIETYSNLSSWNLQASSTGAMTTALKQAYQKEEDIIVTGWSPHWMFASFDLKYLEDPENVFGEGETINTMVRDGFEQEDPEAYAIMDKFHWTVDDMEAVMLDIAEGTEPADAARKWVDDNQDKVKKWVE